MDIGVTIEPAKAGRYYPNIGRPKFSRVFCKPGAKLLPIALVCGHLPTGCLPWVSHKDAVPIDDVRQYWATLAGIYPGLGPIRWTYYHEAAGQNAPNRQSYMRYWADLVSAAKDFPYVELVQIQTNYAMRWRVDTDWRDWLISGVTLGFDCYPLKSMRYEPPETMFGLVKYAAATLGAVRWGVPELGADARPGQDRSAWLSECVEYLGAVGADFVGLWGAGAAYEPSDPATLATFRKLVNLA